MSDNNSTPENNNAQRKLLMVDDDRFFCEIVKDDLSGARLEITLAHSVAEARAVCARANFDVVLLDNNLPDGSGLDLMPDIWRVNDRAKIILVTAFPSFDSAVQALKNGAYDYVSKPVELEELRLTIERALHAGALEAVEQVERYRRDKDRRAAALVGAGAAFREHQEFIRRAALTNASVLITGETGTGKNVVAKAIHYQSESRAAPFISINCAALPETLIESELFGAEKGAFTGANQTRKGTFELADGGTLFLDEIGEMPVQLQAKLLGALEDRRIRRVGGDTERHVNVRVIAATNHDPERAIRENRFRSDLFYRLSVLRVRLAPLRERRDDVPALARYFVEQFAPNRQIEISAEEMRLLQNYDFPGNVRELRNIIERCLILQDGKFIRPSRIIGATPTEVAQIKNAREQTNAEIGEDSTLAEAERQHILRVFARHNNNITRTAAALDISLTTLKNKLRDYGRR